VNQSIPKILLVILVIVIGGSVVAIIDDVLGIDIRILPFAYIMHNVACMIWGIAVWRSFGK